MVKKYFEFVNENIEFILESDVRFSEKFRKVIKKIGGPVSDTLIGLENKDYPVQSNYFDLTDSNDTISFTPDRKVKELLDKSANKWRYAIAGKYASSEEKFNYLWEPLGLERSEVSEPPIGTLGDIGKECISPTSGKRFVEFIPDDKQYDPFPVNAEALKLGAGDESTDFFKLSRQTIRVGRGVRALLNAAKTKISDKEIEEFVNKYKSTIDAMNDIFSNFEIVKGDDIAHWYKYDNYEKGTDRGTLGSSCMADVDQNFFDIYCDNPDRVSLAIYKVPEDDGKIRGRAIVWKLDDGKIFMDRIYTHEDSDVELFRQFAKKNGWYSKYHNSSGQESKAFSPGFLDKNTGKPIEAEVVNLDLKVSLSTKRLDKYPYLDTLKFYNTSSGIISNQSNSGDITLEDTDGGYVTGCDTCDGEGRVSCEECDGNGERQCNTCDGDGDIECDVCDGEGEVDCTKCDGDGNVEDSDGNEIPCDKCDGTGKKKCPAACRRGRVSCEDCDGDGDISCDNCDNGTVDCPECS